MNLTDYTVHSLMNAIRRYWERNQGQYPAQAFVHNDTYTVLKDEIQDTALVQESEGGVSRIYVSGVLISSAEDVAPGRVAFAQEPVYL